MQSEVSPKVQDSSNESASGATGPPRYLTSKKRKAALRSIHEPNGSAAKEAEDSLKASFAMFRKPRAGVLPGGGERCSDRIRRCSICAGIHHQAVGRAAG
jgi:hypothetical protein